MLAAAKPVVLVTNRQRSLSPLDTVEVGAIVNIGVACYWTRHGKSESNWKSGLQKRSQRFPCRCTVAIRLVETEVKDIGTRFCDAKNEWARLIVEIASVVGPEFFGGNTELDEHLERRSQVCSNVTDQLLLLIPPTKGYPIQKLLRALECLA